MSEQTPKSKKVAKVQLVEAGLIKTDTMGVNTVGVITQANAQKASMFMDTDTEQKVLNFIFGKSEDNPFADITADVNSKLENYDESCDIIAENIAKMT